ncbi:MAG TPA: Xaa-Pro peptidase family protein [Bryobacteraceae bacterium]|nr:Xaa-Pro peptidase family protein [Bryobacteraceae bacterium]
MRDVERVERLQEGMRAAGLDALACTLPENVLLLSGYFPVVGASLALATRDGEVTLVVPEDEKELAECGGANRVLTFEPASLERITDAVEAARRALEAIPLNGYVVGFECGASFEPASYASMQLYGCAVPDLFPGATLRPASELLSRMKALLTPIESDRVRRACRIAEIAFERGAEMLCVGLKETEAAEQFRVPLVTVGTGFEGVSRAEGYVFCMSGAHSGKAYGAYARSRSREIAFTDFVLTHCNSHADGYWTDITRTYAMGPASTRQEEMYAAILEARQAALDAIRPGAPAAGVDHAARKVLRARGFGDQFKHATGHGVGFSAISHNARPRIHPKSDEQLEAGMVFNVEPAIYFEGWGGARHCDVVEVTQTGVEVLTPFQNRMEDLIR